MIARLKGVVVEPGVIETRDGIGFEVTTANDHQVGEEVVLRIVTTVRETDISFWGFTNKDDELVFRALMNVSGIGPTAAMSVVRSLGGPELVRAVQAEDADAFKPVPGVGPKTAKKLISTIKLPEGVEAAADRAAAAEQEKVAKTLQSLGYPLNLAEEAAREAAAQFPDASAGELVSKATAHIAQMGGASNGV